MAGGRQLTVTLVANTKSFSAGMVDAVRHAEGFKGKMAAIGASLRSVAGPAFLAAGAAAGAFAVKLAVDGVQAAMAEQRELAVLKQTLDNVGQSFKMDSVNQFIDDLRFLTGVSDSELRPAFSSLIGVTKDAESAQKLLAVAVDASVGSGRDLSSVSMAVAKAVGGSSTALKRLIPELDATTIAGGGADKVISALEKRFGGSASAAAQTFEGKLKRVQDGFGELTESFGKGFLEQMDAAGESTDSLAQALRDAQPIAEDLGRQLADIVNFMTQLGPVSTFIGKALTQLKGPFSVFADAAVGIAQGESALDAFRSAMGDSTLAIDDATSATSDMGTEMAVTAKRMYRDTLANVDAFSRQYFTLEEVAAGAGRYTDSMSLLRAEVRRTTVRLGFLASAFDTANAAMDRRESMKGYKDALKAFIDDPSADSRDAVVQAMIDAAGSFKDPTKQAEFTAGAVDKITDAAKRAGVSVPGWLSAIGESAADQQDPIASLKQAMEEIPTNITSKITVDFEWPDGRPPGGWPKEWYGATGGPVYAATGTHASDNVPAMLSRGEYVLNADTVRRLGVGTLNRINNGGSASGSGVIIENLTVTSAPGERAEESVPRALRRYAFVAGLNG